MDIDLFDAFALVDCGDAPPLIGNIERTHVLVQTEIGQILRAGASPISIGGDHSLYIPGARALSRGVDIGDELQMNCSGLIRAYELPNLAAEQMAVVGVRGTINVQSWWTAVRERDIPVYTMKSVRERGFDALIPQG